MSGKTKTVKIWQSRLGIVGSFIFFTEAVATVSLKFAFDADSEYVGHLVWFIILYPVLLTLLFFYTIWNHHTKLYSPKDFIWEGDSNKDDPDEAGPHKE